MKPIRFISIFIYLLCAAVSGMAQNDATIAVQSVPASYGFDMQHILQAREQAKRVAWTDQTIETHLQQTFSNNYSAPIHKEVVKAALLGGNERALNAMADINTALSVQPESQNVQDWFQTLQSYDCLLALPESVVMDHPSKTEAEKNFSAYAHSLMQITPKQDDLIETALHQAACVYAGIIVGSSEQVHTWLHGGENTNQLWKTLSEAVPNEGIPENGLSFPGYLYVLLSALKNYSQDDYVVLKPWITRLVDIPNLFYGATGYQHAQVIADDPNRYWTLSALERSYLHDSNQASGFVLHQLYERIPRRADMLLFGMVNWDAAPKPNPSSDNSFILPRVGFAFLKDDGDIPISLMMNLGMGSFHTTNGLSIQQIRDENVLGEKMFEHNTVFVDQQWKTQQQENASQYALITSFVPFDGGGTFLSASASGIYGERANYPNDTPGLKYPVTQYQRDLYVSSPYVIDWFRVSGSGVQDYVYQLPGKIDAINGIDLQPFSTSMEAYPFLKNITGLQASKVKGIYSVQTQPMDDNGLSERIWFVDMAESTVKIAVKEKQNILINRREFTEPTANLFAVVHEGIQNLQPADLKMERLNLVPQTNVSSFQAMGFVIQNASCDDIYYSAMQSNQTYTAKYKEQEIGFNAKFAHIKLVNGQLKMMRFVGGTQLSYGGYHIQIDEPVTTGIIYNVDEESGSFDLQMPFLLPFGEALSGHILQVVSSIPETPFLQPLPLSHVEDVMKKQRFHLAHRINLSSPPTSLAAPVQNGDQVLFESFAELKRISDERFGVYHSSPVNITLPATEKNRRIFVDENNVQRLRGELKDGLIHATILPLESYDGKTEVIRVP